MDRGSVIVTIIPLFVYLRRLLRDLRSADSGSVTLVFALAIVPVMGFVGAAVDYIHANSIKSALQAATDATALMLSKNAATLSSAQMQTQALSYLQALFNRPEATGLSVSASYSATNGSQVVISSSAHVKTTFMSMMGFSSLKIGAEAQAKWGSARLRVALVLDTTGSMDADGKMSALKTATKNLLDQLKSAAVNNGDVYVSIIPFSKDVNVGKSNYNANWIDWTQWDKSNGSCSSSKYGSYSNCLSHDKTWTPDDHSTWNGCVTDRGRSSGPSSDNYDTNVVAPTTTITSTLFPAEQYDACSPKVMPLSYDWTAMKDLVDGFYPAGMTNQAIGLAHGWMSLVGGGPYPAPPAMDQNYKYTHVIVLLTDGLNTRNRWYNDQEDIDARQAMTCANIKAAGITLYTVQVNTGGDPTSSLLKTCASDLSKFFLLTTASQMVATFQQIGTNLSNLRIAQ
jgi:Flp pilus assembly protein TadG